MVRRSRARKSLGARERMKLKHHLARYHYPIPEKNNDYEIILILLLGGLVGLGVYFAWKKNRPVNTTQEPVTEKRGTVKVEIIPQESGETGTNWFPSLSAAAVVTGSALYLIHRKNENQNKIRKENFFRELDKGFVRIKGDGNCFFRALAEGILGDQERYQEIKDTIKKMLSNPPEKIKNFIPKSGEFRKEIEDILDNKETWGGDDIMSALIGHAHKANIIIENGSEKREISFPGANKEVTLLYNGSTHYDLGGVRKL